MTDTERIDALIKLAKEGDCPALLNDDNGHWAVSGSGQQNVPEGDGPQDIWTSFLVMADEWYDDPRSAIDAYLAPAREQTED